MEQILIVDDDPNIVFTIERYLKSMSYEVDSANSGTEGLEKALNGKCQAVILDVGLPEMDGFELLKELRKKSEIPVIMLTSRDDVTDKVVGLEIGADDYMSKMFSKRELLARLRAVLRRARKPGIPDDGADCVMASGKLAINTNSHTVTLDGAPLELTPIEYSLLAHMASSPGVVLTRDQLFDALSRRDYEVIDRAIDVHISSLRKKLRDNPVSPRFIKTVRTVGYMFIPND